jgi:hypothetical protein
LTIHSCDTIIYCLLSTPPSHGEFVCRFRLARNLFSRLQVHEQPLFPNMDYQAAPGAPAGGAGGRGCYNCEYLCSHPLFFQLFLSIGDFVWVAVAKRHGHGCQIDTEPYSDISCHVTPRFKHTRDSILSSFPFYSMVSAPCSLQLVFDTSQTCS